MSERYTRVFALEENLYAEGLPVIISAGVLLKDNTTGNILGQLKYKNVSDKTIKGLSVELELFDNANRPLDNTVSYQYLDFSAGPKESFGTQTAIPISDNTARGFKIKIKEVIFTDITIWQGSVDELKPIPKSESLAEYYQDSALVAEYRRLCGAGSKYLPKEYCDLWICTCGEINAKGQDCGACSINFEYATDNLEKAREEKAKHDEERKRREEEDRKRAEEAARRAAEEKKQREEAARKRAEEAKKREEEKAKEREIKKKKCIKIAKIVVPIVVAVIAFLIILFTMIIPNIKYNNAVKKYGIKYVETVKNAKIGDTIKLGNYDAGNGKEEIEWLVLDKEGDKALLISKYSLLDKTYNESRTDVTWETCTLRRWLNDDFLNKAFNDAERALIQTTHVTADKNPKSSTNPGNATEDKIYLLSISEAEKYFKSNDAMKCYKSNKNDAVWWWLRSPGNGSRAASSVGSSGQLYYFGTYVDYGDFEVRPVMWISFES